MCAAACRRNIPPKSLPRDLAAGVQNENSDAACVNRRNCCRRTVIRLQYHSTIEGWLPVMAAQTIRSFDDSF